MECTGFLSCYGAFVIGRYWMVIMFGMEVLIYQNTSNMAKYCSMFMLAVTDAKVEGIEQFENLRSNIYIQKKEKHL
jgi:hypothetical protein